MTLYVIQAVRKEGTIAQVFAGTVPFFMAMVVMTALLIAFPDMALWLPRLTYAPS
jgi:TRAP-type C4-dicarboxylate transport system permease large subunit